MVTIKLLVEGGKMAPGPAVAQQLGPMGLNLGQIISDVNDKTGEFKGMNVPVTLDVNPDTKEYTITVMSPPVSELLKKELGLEKASGERLKHVVGNLAFEQIISVAKQKHDNMLSNDLIASVKSVLGTCQALGVIVESKEIKEVNKEVNEGKYDAMVQAGKTDVSPEKKQELEDYFNDVKSSQDAAAKAEEEAKAAEAEAEATPAEGDETSEEKPAEEPAKE
ncbi:50S ribosomal protein L11 [Candidatus Pacearchaeota archaeon]|nr:50S ribosomal protein L11 [Candidatus Pacearchaeota archaeon]|tara:strand:+ start:15368 stop:16033 length:666 start_codon:yes stop_codon:yes gene_type:complete